MHVLVIDNYDSFTWNLVQAFQVCGARVTVRRNDAVSVDEAVAIAPSHLCISPGPGTPAAAGISIPLIRRLAGHVPILGVCLGHQAIVEAFGGVVIRGVRPIHGKASEIVHDGAGVFSGQTSPMSVGRYHSLVASVDHLPDVLRVSASTSDGVVMAVRHTTHSIEGVQFHPESVLTPRGEHLLATFLAMDTQPTSVPVGLTSLALS